MDCEFCGKSLSSKFSLGRHQRTSKRCLVVQGKLKYATRDYGTRLECAACGRNFARQAWYTEHVGGCQALTKQRDLKREYEAVIENLKCEHKAETTNLWESHQGIVKELQEKLADSERERAILDGRLDEQRGNVRISLSKATHTTNNVICSMGELTPDVGRMLASSIGSKEFWDGQRAIGKALSLQQDPQGRPFYSVKDENRRKYEILQGGSRVRDDRGEKIIETIAEPVKEKIKEVSQKEQEEAGENFMRRMAVMEQEIHCNNFVDKKRNAQFLEGLSSNSCN